MLSLSLLVVFGENDYSLRERLGNFDVTNHMSAEVRFGYIQSDAYDFLGSGGHIHIRTPYHKGLRLNGSLYAFYDLEQGAATQRQKDLFWAEANIEYLYRYLDLMVGRFMVDTPYADSDDIRIVPNYFQGARLLYCDGVVGFEFLYLSKMAGWGSGGDIGQFKSLSEVMGIDGIGSLLGVRLALFDDFVWFYRLENGADLAYVDLDFEDRGYRVAFQGCYAVSSGKELMGSFRSAVVGILLSKEFGPFGCFGAYNKSLEGFAMPAFGGGPYFTSMEELTLDLAGQGGQSVVVGGSRRFGDLSVGVVGGRFFSSGFSQKELDIYISGTLLDRIQIESVYAKVIDRYGHNSKDIFRLILKFGF